MRLPAISAGHLVANRYFSGVIHSVFRRACNISLNNDAFITLLPASSANLPQGIRLATPPGFSFTDHLQQDQPVGCRAGVIRIGGSNLSIDLRPASRWQADLARLSFDLEQPDTGRAWHVAWQELWDYRQPERGAFKPERLLLQSQAAGRSSKLRFLVDPLSAEILTLLKGTHQLQVDQAAMVLEPLVGLGPGLTPAGDDFIIGYLAGLWSAVGFDPARLQFLSALGIRIDRAAAATNDISRAYLRCATAGDVSETLAALARAIAQGQDPARLRQVSRSALEIGDTSGAAAVLGLLIGITAFLGEDKRWLQYKK